MAAAFDAHQRRAAEGGRLLGPDAVAVAVEAVRPAGGRRPRPAQPLAARRPRGRSGGGVVHRVGGCRVRAAGRAGRRERRLRAPASGGGSSRTARRHRGPRRPAGPAPSRSGAGMSRTVWTWARLAGAAATFAVLVWRLGTGPFLDGVRTVDGRALAAAAGIAVLTTVCCAWRWKIVARGLGIDLPLPAAVAAYYRSQFLNVTLPGGVVGDVHRGYQPRSRRERRRPRAAGRRLGALRRAGRAGRPDRRRPARAAVARALVHAAGRDRARRGGARRRARGSGATRPRPLPAGRGCGAPWPATSATGCSPGRAWLGIALASARGRRRPRGHLPDRRADRGHRPRRRRGCCRWRCS